MTCATAGTRERRPWVPDLTVAAGRRRLDAQIARTPAVVVRVRAGAREARAPNRPWLAVVVAPDRWPVIALDHLVRADPSRDALLRRRLAVVRFSDPTEPLVDRTILAWSILARQHADIEAQRRADLERARRLAQVLRR